MPEEIEVETRDLQEAIEELHKDRDEREEEEKKGAWTRYIALTTAILAVFAAVGALQSGALVNEGMIDQLKASDTWNEYQAAREKSHIYSLQANSLIDAGAKITPSVHPKPKPDGAKKSGPTWQPKGPNERTAEYIAQVAKEDGKGKDLMAKARKYEEESSHLMHKHHEFAYAVAMSQVAIALGAVAALTRIKSVWAMSLVAGIAGITMFVLGFAQ